ncbi:MAG: hypothetical protein V3V17_10385 [Alphaproteobacteria bacterium]
MKLGKANAIALQVVMQRPLPAIRGPSIMPAFAALRGATLQIVFSFSMLSAAVIRARTDGRETGRAPKA